MLLNADRLTPSLPPTGKEDHTKKMGLSDEDDRVGMALLNFQHGSRDMIALPPNHKFMDRDRLTLNHWRLICSWSPSADGDPPRTSGPAPRAGNCKQ